MRPFLLHHATVRFSRALYVCPVARCSRTQERSGRSERGSGKENIPATGAGTDALRPLMTKQQKTARTWLNSSRISLCSCWRSLTSYPMLRPTFVRNFHDDAEHLSVHCPRDWMNGRMVIECTECSLVKQHAVKVSRPTIYKHD